MSLAEQIKPFLVEADRRRPDLRVTNTAMSCFELLQLTLALAGGNWAFIGKTRDMDGASVTPPGFQRTDMLLTRPDGQRQTVTIVGVGMDAAYHIPSRTQVKVIANSSANDDPNPDIHGPANLSPYEIDPQYYRWHNPVIPQWNINVPPMPPPSQPPPSLNVLSKEEAYAILQELNAFYQSHDGLQRPGGMVRPDREGRMVADTEAMGQWFYQMVIERRTLDEVKSQIRESYEWKDKHR